MRLKRTILLIALTAALAGCSGLLSEYFVNVERLEHGRRVEVRPGEAVVFGRLVLIEDGVKSAPYRRYDEPIFGMIHLESEKRARGGVVETDGSFYWKLPRGTYLVDAVNYAYRVIPQAAFRVPEGADAYNIGTLVMDLKFATSPDGVRYIKKKDIFVIDEFEEAEKAFRYRSPGYTGEPRKSLMLIDNRLPEDPQKTMDELKKVLILLEAPPSPK